MADALFASEALLPEGWRRNVRISMAGGIVAAIEPDATPARDDERHAVIVPAMPNLHSHAFQRAMAGLAERRGPGDDSFWTWRSRMYQFALGMTPDDVEAVAAQVYVEMLEAGFARVGEFHYLHHAPDGAEYADIGEMATRIVAAGAQVGMGLTLLPVFYAHSGFDGAAPAPEQRRFVNSIDRFAVLVERCRILVGDVPGAVLGIAPHSLRAATLAEIGAILPLAAGGPVHIHVAEQLREVEESLAHSGQRPVESLLGGVDVDEHWCLIHATHMSPAETGAVAASGATVGLCPITESNLGDGIFAAPAFLDAGGQFGVGTDSNVRVSVRGELEALEYAQRLATRSRNVVAAPGASTGRGLFDRAREGGGRALGAGARLAAGCSADLVALDCRSAPYFSGDDILDAWIFGMGVRIDCVWARGHRQVSQGRHIAREEINARFNRTMARLMAR